MKMSLADLALPLIRYLDPERAHRIAIGALKLGLGPNVRATPDPILATNIFGMDFSNPIGLAAGFDKSVEAIGPLLQLGAGFIEVGTLTPRAQTGNPKPRVFRLTEDQAAINRYGFNNDGLDIGLVRLAEQSRSAGIVGINVGINKDSDDQVSDFATATRQATPFADYLTVNVSSPNTLGLRDLQDADQLDYLLDAVVTARADVTGTAKVPPLFLKIAPDVDRSTVERIVRTAINRAADGLVVANTTIGRPNTLKSPYRGEAGGLSGRPVFALSTKVLAWAYLCADGELPVVGVGGVDDADTAYAKIRAGASLVQLYTGLIYKGPGLFRSIAVGLAERLRRDKLTNVADAIGLDAEIWAENTINWHHGKGDSECIVSY